MSTTKLQTEKFKTNKQTQKAKQIIVIICNKSVLTVELGYYNIR